MESCLGHKLVVLFLFVDALKLRSYIGPWAEVRVVADMYTICGYHYQLLHPCFLVVVRCVF